MSEDKVKPTKVEVGQRFQYRNEIYVNEIYVVTGGNSADGWRIRFEDAKGGYASIHRWKDSEILCDTYLGGPLETPEAPKPASGQRWKANIGTCGVFTLSPSPTKPGEFIRIKEDGGTGGVSFTAEEIIRNSTFVDNGTPEAPKPGTGEEQCRPGLDCSRGKSRALCKRVSDGATPAEFAVCACECHPDHGQPFPRLPRSQQGPACDHSPCKYGCTRGTFADTTSKATAPAPARGRLVGETLSPAGVPLTALSAVPCRRSSEQLKPVEPWVPSIDDWDLLPDAPGFRS